MDSKEPACDAGVLGSTPGSGRSPGGGPDNPPVVLPRESHGKRSLVGCSPWGHKELDMTCETSPWSPAPALTTKKLRTRTGLCGHSLQSAGHTPRAQPSADLGKSLPPEKDHSEQTEEQDDERKALASGRSHLWTQSPSSDGMSQEVTETQPPKDKKKCLERRNINNGNKRQNRFKKKKV